jgi:hypothetical protein
MVRWWRRRGAVGIWKSGMACLSAHLAASCFFFSFRAASLDVEDDMSSANGAFVTERHAPLGASVVLVAGSSARARCIGKINKHCPCSSLARLAAKLAVHGGTGTERVRALRMYALARAPGSPGRRVRRAQSGARYYRRWQRSQAAQQRSHTQKTGEDLYIRPKSHTSTHLLARKLLSPLYGNRRCTARSIFGYRSSFAK